MEFSRQEYWSGLPFPSPGDHPNPGIKPRFLHAGRFFTSWATWEFNSSLICHIYSLTLLFIYLFIFSMFRLVALFSNLVISFKLLPSLAFSIKACALYVPRCLCIFFFLALTCNMQNLSSLTRDWTCAPCGGSVESQPLDHQGSPSLTEFPNWEIICVHHNALLLIIHNLQTSPENKNILLVTTRPFSCPEKSSVIL